MKLYRVLITIAFGILVALSSPQLTDAHNIILGIETPLNVVATAGAEDFLTQGNEKFDLKDYKGAIKAYTQAIHLNPNDAGAYFNRGNAYAKLKDDQQAIKDFSQVLRIAPNDAGAYFNRGNAHFALKDAQGAIEDFTQAIRLNPNNDGAYFNRGLSRSLLKNYQGAIEDLTQTIRLNPNNDRAYVGLGNAHFALRDDQEALENYNQAIRINPDNILGYLLRGDARAILKDYKGAIEDFTQAIRLNPEDDETYLSRGSAYFTLKDHRKAIEDYTQAIRFNFRNKQAYFSRGISRSLLKDYQGAIEDFTQVIHLNPENAKAYFLRGDDRALLKDYQGAIEDYTQGLRMETHNETAKKTLEQLKANNNIHSGYNTSQRFQITFFVSILLCLLWILSISLHEFGHAVAAHWGGDISVKTRGYLTLNPLKYTHPLISIILPAVFFAFGAFPLPGAAVYIEHRRLRNRWWRSFVAAAGPIASFLVTLFLIVLFRFSLVINAPYWLSSALAFFISLHFFFMLFNLIPIPPLDGYGIIEVWLPTSLQVQLRRFALVGLAAVYTLFLIPQFGQFMAKLAFAFTQLFGVSDVLALSGFELFNRWYCALPLATIGVFVLIRKPQVLWRFLAEMMLGFRKFDLAFAAYDRAAKLAPNDASIWTRRGWLLHSAQLRKLSLIQRHETALQSFNRAIQINPNYYSSWEGRGWMLYLLGRYNEAIVAYDRVIALEQNDYLVWHERGTVLVTLGRCKEALSNFNKAIELRPDIDWLQNRRNLLLRSVAVDSREQ